MANFMPNSSFSLILDILTCGMCHMLPLALFSVILNLLVSTPAVRHCALVLKPLEGKSIRDFLSSACSPFLGHPNAIIQATIVKLTNSISASFSLYISPSLPRYLSLSLSLYLLSNINVALPCIKRFVGHKNRT